jgi:hypothetical protein
MSTATFANVDLPAFEYKSPVKNAKSGGYAAHSTRTHARNAPL